MLYICAVQPGKTLHWQNPYFSIGLTGSIGSGKSTAAGIFRSFGCIVSDADMVAREVLESEEIRPELIKLFGEDVIDSDTNLPDRQKIAAVVFQNPGHLKKLNGLIHPRVAGRREESLRNLKPGDVFVYDVPLLFEGGLDGEFDLTILIFAADSVRFERARQRSGMTKEEFQNRNNSQMPQQEKRKRADITIENNTSLDELKEKIQNIYDRVMSGVKR